ncbi:hypothetical protein BUE80_DR011911 [Diplocarpon rosae]|nr:hypothetical protein BUE80_DR011911 [Diplocarpon rosae]
MVLELGQAGDGDGCVDMDMDMDTGEGLANGYFTQKYGHRPAMMVSLLLMTGFIFVTFFAPNVETLLVGAFLCSIP